MIAQKRQNLDTYSEQFDNAAWPKSNVTIVADAGVAPDGTATADLMYPTTTGSLRRVSRVVFAIAAPVQPVTVSVYAKASGMTWLSFFNLQAGAVVAWFDLTNGAIGTVTGGNGVTYAARIEAVGNGWYRCSMTQNVPSVGSCYASALVSDGDGTTTATTNGTDGILLWGAQCVIANHPGPYTPTVASAVYTGNIRNIANVNQYRLEELTMGEEGFVSSTNYLRTAVGQIMPGDVNGFFVSVAVMFSAAPTGRIILSRADGPSSGWDITASAGFLQVYVVDGAGAMVARKQDSIAAGAYGKVLLFTHLYDSVAGTQRLFRAGAELGVGSAMAGYTPTTAAGRSSAGAFYSGTDAGAQARIVGALYGTGIPTAANILAHYNSCKRENRMVTMPGSVTNVNRWEARDYTPAAAGSWVDNIGGMILTQTGTLTRVPFAPRWE